MASTIKWIDNNVIGTAHRIYKSSTYFTKDDLPAPLVELGPDVTEYVDSAGVDGENWYIVSALLNDYEVFSEPFIPGFNNAYIHDVFGDGSVVATYNFDGDATDLGGTYNGNNNGGVFVSGVIEQSIEFSGSQYVDTTITASSISDASFSFWTEVTNDHSGGRFVTFENNNSGVFCISYESGAIILMMHGSSVVASNDNISPNSGFIHVCGDTDGNLYINTVKQSGSYPTTKGSGPSNVEIGAASNTSSQWSYTKIDQLRIFNRALTQAEVDTLYQEEAAYL